MATNESLDSDFMESAYKISPPIRNDLRKAGRWAIFVGFVGALYWLVIFFQLIQAIRYVGIAGSIMQLLLLIVQFLILLFIGQFGLLANKALKYESNQDFLAAFQNLKNYFLLASISLILSLGLFLISLLTMISSNF